MFPIVLAAAACTGEVTVERLAGTYVMSLTRAADTLRLRADGRYLRTYAAPQAPVMTDSGTWFLTRDKRMIGLHDYPKRWAFVHDLRGDTTRGRILTVPSMLALTIEHSWNRRPRLGWHSDFGWTYRRAGSGE